MYKYLIFGYVIIFFTVAVQIWKPRCSHDHIKGFEEMHFVVYTKQNDICITGSVGAFGTLKPHRNTTCIKLARVQAKNDSIDSNLRNILNNSLTEETDVLTQIKIELKRSEKQKRSCEMCYDIEVIAKYSELRKLPPFKNDTDFVIFKIKKCQLLMLPLMFPRNNHFEEYSSLLLAIKGIILHPAINQTIQDIVQYNITHSGVYSVPKEKTGIHHDILKSFQTKQSKCTPIQRRLAVNLADAILPPETHFQSHLIMYRLEVLLIMFAFVIGGIIVGILLFKPIVQRHMLMNMTQRSVAIQMNDIY